MPNKQRTLEIDGRNVQLSNVDKKLYPAGFTKGDVIDYYRRIAPFMLPHLRGRAVTFVRFPDSVEGDRFFEKHVPRGAPKWVRTARVPSTGEPGSGEMIEHPLVGDAPSLVWAANLAALELHVPQWTVGRSGVPKVPDRMVFDLDPGSGATVIECCRVAERLCAILIEDGLDPMVKTSGSKGLQVYCGVRTRQRERTSNYAKGLAHHLAEQTPQRVVAKMAKTLRAGKVFIDWSQNNPAKTTVAPYSLRGRDRPTVSTPITWDEVRDCGRVEDLSFTADDVLGRVEEFGDLFEGLHESRQPLPR